MSFGLNLSVSFSVFLPGYLSLTRCLSFSVFTWSFRLLLAAYLSLSLFFSWSFRLVLAASLSLSFSLIFVYYSLYLFFSHWLSVSDTLSLFLILCLSPWISISYSLPLLLCLSPCLSVSYSLPLFLFLCLSLWLSVS